MTGNPLEPFTTIIRKLNYEGLKTKGLGVLAAKLLSVYLHMENVHRLGQCQPVEHKLMVFEKVCSFLFVEKDEEIVESHMKV